MKKFFFIFGAAALLLAALSSCSKVMDEPLPNNGETTTILVPEILQPRPKNQESQATSEDSDIKDLSRELLAQ